MKTRLPFTIIALLAIAAGYWTYGQSELDNRTIAEEIDGFLWPNPKAMTPFKITDNAGKPFDLSRLENKWTFLFFGYTHCPDICPGTLGMLNLVEKQLAATEGFTDAVQFVFVSVDPERDKQKNLAEYVQYFNHNFLSATDTPAYLGSLTRQLGVVHIINEKQPDGQYTVDHTASVLLISPTKKFVGVFGTPHDPADIVQRFLAMRDVIQKG